MAGLDIEKEVGQSVISATNAKTPKALDETRESLLNKKRVKKRAKTKTNTLKFGAKVIEHSIPDIGMLDAERGKAYNKNSCGLSINLIKLL